MLAPLRATGDSRPMRFHYLDLAHAGEATGTVVVIDVLRAFTTAPVALAAGAVNVTLVGTVEEALAVRDALGEGALAMGEVDGRPVPAFDLSNSPSAVDGRDLTGRHLVQRTTAGTQGVVASVAADARYVASFVCAEATVRAIREDAPAHVTFLVTGAHSGRDGDEDRACADYLAARLRGQTPDPAPFVARVKASDAGRMFGTPDHPWLPADDLVAACEIDRFGLALPVAHEDGRFVVRPAMVRHD